MKTLTKTAVVNLVCLAMVSAALAQKPEASKDARRAQRTEGPQREMRGGGMPNMGDRDEPSRESMLARFVTDREVAQKLGLTEDQIAKLKECSVDLRKRAIRLKADQELAGMEHVELLSAEELDEEALMKAIEKTGRIRTEIAKLQIQPIIALKQTLTPAQLEQAKKMLHERMRLGMREGDGQRGPEGRQPRGGDRDRGPRPPDRNHENGPRRDGPPAAEPERN